MPSLEKESTCFFFQFYLLRNITTKKNSLLFKVKIVDNDVQFNLNSFIDLFLEDGLFVEFNLNSFVDLFLEDGLFEPYLDEVYSIATHNYQSKIHKVTFKETTPKKILEDLYNTFYEPETITTRENIKFSIQVNRPLGFR